MDFESLSELTPCGYQGGSCGYCKDPVSSNSYFAKTTRLTTEHYQYLVDRGWRRSGSLLYKPDVKRSCCPHYTIRLPVAAFKSSRDQRQTLHRWNRFVLGEKYEKDDARVHPKSKREKAQSRQEFNLFETIHRCEHRNLKPLLESEHQFEVNLEHDDYSEEKFELYQNYQKNVHKEPSHMISKSGFKRFLCGSPLKRISRFSGGKEQLLGSFHQCYRLDGRLIAMGVLDLLPHAVSGVYFVYHEDFEKWSMGKLSALREAALAIEGGYEYYYMGYYIHSCVKMRYKGDYKPQYILDPETYAWHALDESVKMKLSESKYLSFLKEQVQNGENRTSKDEKQSLEDLEILQIHDPAKAAEAGLTVFDLRVPGVMSLEQMESTIQLEHILIQIGRMRKQIVPVGALVAWDDSSFHDPRSLKGIITDLVACVGLEVAREMIVKLS